MMLATAIAVDVSPASAAVATTIAFSCTPTSLSAPASASCTATLTNDRGSTPSGTVTMSKNGTLLDFAGAGPTCSVVPLASPPRTAACSLTVILFRPGQVTITAAFTNAASGDNPVGTTSVAVSPPGSPKMFTPHSQNAGNHSGTDQVPLYAAGCSPGSYLGLVSSPSGDPQNPAFAASAIIAEVDATPVASDQSWSWQPVIPTGASVGTWHLRWYCAAGQLASAAQLTDATAVSWVSSEWLFNVS